MSDPWEKLPEKRRLNVRVWRVGWAGWGGVHYEVLSRVAIFSMRFSSCDENRFGFKMTS